MRAEEVAALYTLLAERGIRVWVDGGWGFDALVPFDDLARWSARWPAAASPSRGSGRETASTAPAHLARGGGEGWARRLAGELVLTRGLLDRLATAAILADESGSTVACRPGLGRCLAAQPAPELRPMSGATP